MDNVLHSMYFRLDISSKCLSNSALAQLILKFVFSMDRSITERDIKVKLKEYLGIGINNRKISDAIVLLEKENKIYIDSGKITITRSCMKQLDKTFNEHQQRLDRIIGKYFVNCNTTKEVLLGWFEDIMIEFFNVYYYDWINDLFKKNQ